MTNISSDFAAKALIDEAIEQNAKGVPRADIASRIMGLARNRDELEAAYLLWQRNVHLQGARDADGIAVLRVLERALNLSPRLPGFGAAPRGI